MADQDTECKNAPQCAPAKHHFDECVERVQQQESEGDAKEDCVEECTSFFSSRARPPPPSAPFCMGRI